MRRYFSSLNVRAFYQRRLVGSLLLSLALLVSCTHEVKDGNNPVDLETDPTLITSLTASTLTVPAGEAVQLSWQVPDESLTLTLEPDIGDVSGLSEAAVWSVGETTYTLSAKSTSSKATRKIEVEGQLPSTNVAWKLGAGHTAEVRYLDWSPTGQLLATSGADGMVKLWDATTGSLKFTLDDHFDSDTYSAKAEAVAFSPDGLFVASGSGAPFKGGSLKVWSVATGEVVADLVGHTEEVTDIAWSPDGTKLVSCGDALLRVWDIASGQELWSLDNYTYNAVAWSQDGEKIVGGDRSISVWNAETGEHLYEIDVFGGVWDVDWNADSSQFVSSGNGGKVVIWDADTGQPVRVLLRDDDEDYFQPLVVAWEPNTNRILGGGTEGELRIWDAATGREMLRVVGKARVVLGADWHPDGDRFAADDTIPWFSVWNAESGQKVMSSNGHAARVATVKLHEGKVASGGYDGTVKVWEAASGRSLGTLAELDTFVHAIAWHPDGSKLASASGQDNEGALKIWDMATRKQLFSVDAHRGEVYAVGWSPDGTRLASGGQDGTIKVRDGTTGSLLKTFEVQDYRPIFTLAWSPDGTKLAGGGYDEVKVWDAETSRLMHTFTIDRDPKTIAWSPDSQRLAVGGSSGKVQIIDSTSEKTLATIEAPYGIDELAWSPDGHRLATSGSTYDDEAKADDGVHVWVAATGERITGLEGHQQTTFGDFGSLALDWSSDGDSLVSGGVEGALLNWVYTSP